MYKAINLNSIGYNHYFTGEGDIELKKLSKVNIFIGPNNSGKSRLLRALFSSTDLEFTTTEINLEEINDAVSSLKEQISNYYTRAGIVKVEGIDLDKLDEVHFIKHSSSLKLEIYDTVEKISKISPKANYTYQHHSNINPHDMASFIASAAEDCLIKIKNLKSYNFNEVRRESIYIPTLRGLRGIDYGARNNELLGRDNYQKRTIIDYFEKGVEDANEIDSFRERIYTGLSFYEDVKRLLLGSSSKRTKIKEFETFLSKTFFDNKELNIIPLLDDNVVHVKIGDEEYPIYDLGEGIQSIIILIYPLFINQGKKLNIFYEEPDLFLHPGYQRVFLDTLFLDHFKSFQFFFTTHSNHFLDMTLDFSAISVYKFQKEKGNRFVVENVKNDDKNLLQILGVRNSSVFLSNCTIWVEGITDRIYIRKYLELYQSCSDFKHKRFQEDIHYSFVEYGGGNITHWSFLDSSDDECPNINVDKLCGKLFLISDRDSAGLLKGGGKSKKMKRHEELENQLGDNYCCLESREIENLLTEGIISNVVKDCEGENADNIDFSKLKISSYKDKPLGSFIDAKVAGLKRSYGAESGTVKDKVNFAKNAIKHLSHFNDLSDEAKDLTRKIYNFIRYNN